MSFIHVRVTHHHYGFNLSFTNNSMNNRVIKVISSGTVRFTNTNGIRTKTGSTLTLSSGQHASFIYASGFYYEI